MNLDTQTPDISAEVIREVIPVTDSLRKEAMFVCVCSSEVCLKCHSVLISATPILWDLVICRNSTFTFHTFVRQRDSAILPPFLEGFNSARMSVIFLVS